MPPGVENAGLSSDADGSAATRAINERLQRLEELQTRQLEHQIQEARERAEFKRWWIRQQKHQLREQERAMQAPPTLTRQSPAAALPGISSVPPPTLPRQSPAPASPGISSEKGKSIPGKSLAKKSPGTFQDCQSIAPNNNSMGETEEMGVSSLTLGTEEAAAETAPETAEASSDMPPSPEPSSFQRFLRTVTRSKQSLTQIDGNLSDDEMSNCDDPSFQLSQDDLSSTEESDFFTDDSCTEDEASQRSFKSKCSRDQGPILYKHFLLLKIELN